MTSPDNVMEIAEANPDYMGFIFFPGSKRYVGQILKTGYSIMWLKG